MLDHQNNFYSQVITLIQQDSFLAEKFISADFQSRQKLIESICIDNGLTPSSVELKTICESPQLIIDDSEVPDSILESVSGSKGGHSYNDRSVSVAGNVNDSTINT